MIDLRYSDLPAIRFLFPTNTPIRMADGGEIRPKSSVFFPIEAGAVDPRIAVLNEIHRSYLDDLDRRRDVIGGIGADADAYTAREFWRIGSYVVFACTLHRLLAQVHSRCVSFHPPAHAPYEAAVEGLEEEMGDMLTLRKKLFAHTAWAEPPLGKKMDSASTKATSLFRFSMFAVEDDGISLAGEVSVDDGGGPNVLPSTKMSQLVAVSERVVMRWADLTRDAVMELREIRDDEWHCLMPLLENVIRPDIAPTPIRR